MLQLNSKRGLVFLNKKFAYFPKKIGRYWVWWDYYYVKVLVERRGGAESLGKMCRIIGYMTEEECTMRMLANQVHEV